MRIHRVYCKSVSKTENQFSLDSKQSHHLIKALRLKQKSSIEVFDGDGYSAICEITFLNNKNVKQVNNKMGQSHSISIPNETLYSKKLSSLLTKNNIKNFLIVLPDGEKNKSFEVLMKIFDEIQKTNTLYGCIFPE